MKIADIPTKFPIPWGNGASAPYINAIPEASQIGVTAGRASLTDGFPPVTFDPVNAGGTPPFGGDANGILNQSTSWDRWFSAGGPVRWDSTFSTSIGGYPLGAVVQALIPGGAWISTTDDNTTNPDTGGAGWSPYGSSTGDAKITLKTAADYGWLMMNDGTIGNASSGGTTYANALAEALFTLIWNGVSNTWAPTATSAGAPVGRGVSAAADFAANRRISLTRQLGRALAIAGTGTGLSARALGQYLGEEVHFLTRDEMPAHIHEYSKVPNNGGSAIATGGTLGNNTVIDNTTPTGGDEAHNNMQPTAFWNIMIKL